MNEHYGLFETLVGVAIILMGVVGLFALAGGWAILIIVFLMLAFKDQLSGR